MRGDCLTDHVGFPDVHFVATRSVLADAGGAGRRVPVQQIGFAVDELDVVRALGITIACTILGASFVARKLTHTAVRVHLHEVQSAVDTC